MRQAAGSSDRVASLKATLEWVALFVGLVIPTIAAIGGIAWKVAGESIASSYIGSVITANEKDSKQIVEDLNKRILQSENDAEKKRGDLEKRISHIENFEQVLRDSFLKDVSSAYFLSKTYSVGKEDSTQENLQGFFYATSNDKITLSIFTTEHHPDLYVSINGAAQISLRDIAARQQTNDWTDVDIGSYVKGTPLTDGQYIALPRNVNLISVTPSPKRLKFGYTFDLYALITVRPSS